MIVGHRRILEYLKKSVQKNNVAHAYLFVGPENVGKKTIALEFIKILIGEETEAGVHPDILIIEPKAAEKEGIKKEKEIGIDEARQIRRQMSLSPYKAPYKIVLINQAERMTRDAANALLKTLEEPSGKAVLILIAANPQLLFPTIVSRCQIIKFLPVPIEEIKKSLYNKKYKIQNTKYETIIRLSSGRPGLAIQYLKNPKLLEKQEELLKELQKIIQSDLNERYQYVENLSKDATKARQIINQWLMYFRDMLLSLVGCKDLALFDSFQSDYSLSQIKNIIRVIKKTDLLLSNSSINARLALEVLMLEF
ncbi:MAG: hypothetical protein A3A94_00440 [Candidatus Portnoybacteria bacterium RIFCSPLOWO2_01_FULL_43_11]|uniref:DNA polymerase III subunit delta n=3 Tax=Candidatus Portnoyibacteriota TaxID=1817913 RepID=A0A1G2FBF7_9BACT|nr:MAG: hypothetical protein A2815_01665 [Candidatus Portnoybacteria bacterium RIFCSPHIGHO2_01_FULL_40_12b]OGZ39206.1 MAG: hypothetical protein A3A94_00440 [Candidatus Portnoybacteria bacterium RIFCSPLOWO2_01_FULL_43_11]OGZ40969.1 MAG: hypothetical protein A3I20_03030 [Candidatus Portnoybacteria bacterium RIFCSPLOWO2_02_FULL_40_15]